MIELLIGFAVFVIVVVVLWWLLTQLPLPEPAGQIIRIAVVVLVAVVVIAFLLQGGVGGLRVPR